MRNWRLQIENLRIEIRMEIQRTERAWLLTGRRGSGSSGSINSSNITTRNNSNLSSSSYSSTRYSSANSGSNNSSSGSSRRSGVSSSSTHSSRILGARSFHARKAKTFLQSKYGTRGYTYHGARRHARAPAEKTQTNRERVSQRAHMNSKRTCFTRARRI